MARQHAVVRNWRSILCLGCALLSGCVSYEPRQLVPSITLSPEDLQLVSRPANPGDSTGVDFGLTVTSNESDSLFNVEVLPGVRIREVTAGGPAALAGLRAGDVILSVNSTEVNQPDTLEALAQLGQESTDFTFQVRRGTAVLEADVIGRPQAAAGAALQELYRTDPLATRADYQTVMVQVRDRGEIAAARIVELAADSPLREEDLQPGDVILALDGSPVGSAQGLIDSLLGEYALGDQLTLTVFRDEQLLERRIRLWDPGRRINRLSLRPLLFYESDLASQQTRFSLFDFWIFAVYQFDRSGEERQHELLEIFSLSSDYGELVEETPQR